MSALLERPLRRIQDLLPDLIDPKIGIVRFVVEHPTDVGAPQLFRYVARTADTRAFGCVQNFSSSGGAALERNDAIVKAIGEGLERYSAAIYQKEDFPLSTYRNATFTCTHPSEFSIYDNDQFNKPGFMFHPFLETTPARWVAAENIVTGSSTHVPAGLVYVPYHYTKNEVEVPLAQPISTGLACHCSQEEAIIGGLCEVIERDAFTITWQAELTRPNIRLSSLSPQNQDLVERYQCVGYDVHLIDITSDTGVATVMAVLRGKTADSLPIAVSSSADLDPEDAVKKALEELAHTERHSVQLMHELPRLDEVDNYTNVNSQSAHLNFWCSHHRVHLTDFLIRSEHSIDFKQLPKLSSGDVSADLKKLASNIASTGHQPLFVDVTSEDLSQLGLSVVRALIPGFHPLIMGHQLRALGGKRLWHLPQKLGFAGRTRAEGDYPYPHPFP